jgi:hypothetical protein
MRNNVLTSVAAIVLGVCMALPAASAGDTANAPAAGPPIQGTWNCETTQANALEASNAQESWPLHETDTIESLLRRRPSTITI